MVVICVHQVSSLVVVRNVKIVQLEHTVASLVLRNALVVHQAINLIHSKLIVLFARQVHYHQTVNHVKHVQMVPFQRNMEQQAVLLAVVVTKQI